MRNSHYRTRIPTGVAQRGVALLASLILMLAVVMSLANIFYRHQIDISQATSALHDDQALLIAMSGESWARDLLSDRLDNRNVDSFDEDWAQAMPMMPVDGGQLRGCIADLQANINLNNFATYGAGIPAAEMTGTVTGFATVWLNLLQQLDLPTGPARTATLIDWVDSNSNPVNRWGAEQSDYDAMRPPRMPANSWISDVSELAAIGDYQVHEVQLLVPWLSALPNSSTPLNINTASDQVLAALGGRFGSQFVEAVTEGRPFNSVNDFHQLMSKIVQTSLPDAAARWPSSLIDVKSDYFQLYMEVTLGEARIEVKSIMDRKGRKSPVIIARDVIVVPASLPQTAPRELSQAEQLFAGGGTQSAADINQSTEMNMVQPACLMIGEINT